MTSPTTPAAPPRPARRENTVQHKVFGSYLVMAGLGMAVLLPGLGGSVLSRAQTDALQISSHRSIEAVHLVRSGITRSQRALQSWVFEHMAVSRRQRQQAWRTEIEPGLSELTALGVHAGTPSLDAINRRLTTTVEALRTWQWWIEDIAPLVGNHPAHVAYLQTTEPVANSVTEAIGALLVLEQSAARDLGDSLNPLLTALRDAFASSHRALQDFVEDGTEQSQRRFHAATDTTLRIFTEIRTDTVLLTGDQQDIVNWLGSEIRAFRRLADELFAPEPLSRIDRARSWLVTEAQPLADTLETALDTWAVTHRNSLETQSSRAQSTRNLGMAGSGVMLLLVLTAASITAKRSIRMTTASPARLRTATEVPSEPPVSTTRTPTDTDGNDPNSPVSHSHDVIQGRSTPATLSNGLPERTQTQREFIIQLRRDVEPPLSAIVNVTRLLLDSKPTDFQQKYLELLDRTGDSLLATVDNALKSSSNTDGQMDLAFTPTPRKSDIALEDDTLPLLDPSTTATDEAILDWDAALNTFNGDRAQLTEAITTYLDQGPALRAGLRSAIEGGEAAVVRRAAQTIKSGLDCFGEPRAVALAFRLEEAGRRGWLESAAEQVAALEQELNRIEPELRAFLNS